MVIRFYVEFKQFVTVLYKTGMQGVDYPVIFMCHVMLDGILCFGSDVSCWCRLCILVSQCIELTVVFQLIICDIQG